MTLERKFQDQLRDDVRDLVRDIMARRAEIMPAFVAKYGIDDPEQCVQEEWLTDDGHRCWRMRRLMPTDPPNKVKP